MQLSARLLTDVGSVNDFDFITSIEAGVGDAFDVYLQLIDKQKHPASKGFNPGGLRYIPAAGATMSVRFDNLNAAKQFSRVATQPFATDTSIWRCSVLSSDPLTGTISITITLTEGAVIRSFHIPAAILVSGGPESC